ncbi:MAG: UDP-N-acetylmuramoyl-L-alanine--D-glutamate ligase [Bryobacterales bacterium]
MRYEGREALIVGLGESGKAAARFLAARGASVAITDSRSEAQLASALAEIEDLNPTLYLGGHPDQAFEQCDLIVPSPGVPWNMPQLEAARAAGVPVMGELELAAPELRGRVIGVTGSNGKTTTTALVGHILEQAGFKTVVAGNIGTPVLAIVDDSEEEQRTVLELSSFQLEAMRTFRCHVAACLNVTPDHLDRHGTFECYAAAKKRIFDAQRPEDAAVLNADDATCRSWGAAVSSRVRWFSRRRAAEPGVWAADGLIYRDGVPVSDCNLPIPGAHNLENALAATAVCSLAGATDAHIERGLHSFQAVEHRLEHVRRLHDVDYYNDSKATNVDAALKAIESFERGLWIILGGRDKNSDYTVLAEPLAGRVREALLIGEAADKIRTQLGGRTPLRDCGTLEQAVRFARKHAAPGDTVLLSPACASFDQFQSYGHRGREFKRLVEELT